MQRKPAHCGGGPQAADEIIAIFHFDALAFPRAVAAGTAFLLLSSTLRPILALCVDSLFYTAATMDRRARQQPAPAGLRCAVARSARGVRLLDV